MNAPSVQHDLIELGPRVTAALRERVQVDLTPRVGRVYACTMITDQEGQQMTSKDAAATIRKALRARGFTGSVRIGRGTARSWIEITGSQDFGTFTEAENAVLRATFGDDARNSNLYLIAPDSERDRCRLTQSHALEAIAR